MSRQLSEGGSPVALGRTTSIRKLTQIWRPTRRVRAQPSLSIPDSVVDSPTPPSSPSLYSLSSNSDSHPKLSPETETSPTFSTFSASEERGSNHTSLIPVKHPVQYASSDLTSDRGELDTLAAAPSPVALRKARRSSVDLGDYTRAVNKAHRIRPPRILISDKDGGFLEVENSDIASAGQWSERAKLQPLSPSEWIGANVQAKKVLGLDQASPIGSENRSPLDAPSSSSSPVTPRPRPHSVFNRPFSKQGGGLTISPYTITECSELEPLTEQHRRTRSVSEPRSFLGTTTQDDVRHAGTVPATPTEYIFPVRDVGIGLEFTSSPTIFPPPRNSSFRSAMPEDVYYTAAGRRESRIYITPDAAPNSVPFSPVRGHAYSSSDPVFHVPLNAQSSSGRFATRNSSKRKEASSARPFEDVSSPGAIPDGGSTPVLRKEEDWAGEWNRDDIRDVIRELRYLK
ncbi:hypothetical protein B0H11DRAFT_2223157 [Mycena galericulata]|nr:hypothetical protein B0H11DRAFT_2223157 [Mycena galericulata]